MKVFGYARSPKGLRCQLATDCPLIGSQKSKADAAVMDVQIKILRVQIISKNMFGAGFCKAASAMAIYISVYFSHLLFLHLSH